MQICIKWDCKWNSTICLPCARTVGAC